MNQLNCKGCRGLCCGPVAVTGSELTKIKKKVKSMPKKLRDGLKNQNRLFGTCIFFDMDNDRCGIYSTRPKACQMFGYYKGMACFRNPELATKSIGPLDEPIGVLSIDFTWKDF